MTDNLIPSVEEALAAWRRQVRENREQAERFREAPEKQDFYAPTADIFKADPRRKGDRVLETLLSLAKPDETWLDIGAGSGRYALPLAFKIRQLIALDPSRTMLDNLRRGVKEFGIENLSVVEARWPTANPPRADVALISNVGYDIEEIGPFLDAMESAARRLCVAVLFDRAPAAQAQFAWPLIHGVQRVPLPALREFLVLQLARGRLCEVRLNDSDMGGARDRESLHAFLRQQLFIETGGAKDKLLAQEIEKREGEPGQALFAPRTRQMGVVSWAPR
jgi:hypothetical protein